MPASQPAPSLAARARANPVLRRRALANPGLRSKLPASMLPGRLRAQRATQRRLAQPVVPGGSLTQAELKRQTAAMATTKYAPLEAQQRQAVQGAQAQQRDVGGWYDQYLAALAQHSQNVANIQQQAQQNLAGTQAGITGLSGQDYRDLQSQANADAAQRQAVAADFGRTASDAAAIRQALIGSFQAQQAGEGAAAQGYADALARVVAPTQKLAGLAQAAQGVTRARQAQQTTALQRGADITTWRAQLTDQERKNILAAQALGVKTQAELAKEAAGRATRRETRRSHVAGERLSGQRIQAERDRAAANAARAANKRTTSGPFAGKTQREIDAMTDAQASAAIKAYGASRGGRGGRGGGGGGGPRWLTPGQSGKGLGQLASLQRYARKAQQGQPFTGNQPQARRNYSQALEKLQQRLAAPAHPILYNAALDAVYKGYLTPATERGLIAAGYKPSDVSRTLRVPTAQKSRTFRNTRAYGKAPPQPMGHA